MGRVKVAKGTRWRSEGPDGGFGAGGTIPAQPGQEVRREYVESVQHRPSLIKT